MTIIDKSITPVYRCHKEVHAQQIAAVVDRAASITDPRFRVTLQDGSVHELPREMTARYEKLKPGDYIVAYEDGYESISPQAVFEAGYTKLDV